MRTHGTLMKWNDDRGFGFIDPAGGGGELFVHVSAFPRDGVRPRVGEIVSFDIETGSEGKRRAVRIMRPGGTASRHVDRVPPKRSQSRPLSAIGGLLLLAALGWFGYLKHEKNHEQPPALQALYAPPDRADPAPPKHRVVVAEEAPLPAAHAPRIEPATSAPHFSCDGRTMCSQMKSCAEATYFLRTCPTVRMDGDGDGVPCERQWCNAGR